MKTVIKDGERNGSKGLGFAVEKGEMRLDEVLLVTPPSRSHLPLQWQTTKLAPRSIIPRGVIARWQPLSSLEGFSTIVISRLYFRKFDDLGLSSAATYHVPLKSGSLTVT